MSRECNLTLQKIGGASTHARMDVSLSTSQRKEAIGVVCSDL